jgi:DNA-binding XRE family transcriptional regulator
MTSSELAELRKRFGWSQAEAAQKLGCSTRSIVNWEKGVSPIPDSIALAASAVCMNLPPYGKQI